MREGQAPRLIIQHFAAAMERKLAQRDHKPEWRHEYAWDLLVALRSEVHELFEACYPLRQGVPCEDDYQAALDECCDVALYAMMLADRLALLPPTCHRGQVPAPSDAVVMAAIGKRDEVW